MSVPATKKVFSPMARQKQANDQVKMGEKSKPFVTRMNITYAVSAAFKAEPRISALGEFTFDEKINLGKEPLVFVLGGFPKWVAHEKDTKGTYIDSCQLTLQDDLENRDDPGYKKRQAFLEKYADKKIKSGTNFLFYLPEFNLFAQFHCKSYLSNGGYRLCNEIAETGQVFYRLKAVPIEGKDQFTLGFKAVPEEPVTVTQEEIEENLRKINWSPNKTEVVGRAR